jgi:hypothetical protein
MGNLHNGGLLYDVCVCVCVCVCVLWVGRCVIGGCVGRYVMGDLLTESG